MQKKLLIFSFTLACFVTPLPFIAQSRWVEIVTTQLGDRVMVDRGSLRVIKQGRLRRVNFIVKTLYSSPESDGTVKTAAKYSADCLTNSLGTEWFTNYDNLGKILVDINRWSGFTPVQEGSVGEALHEYACQHLNIR